MTLFTVSLISHWLVFGVRKILGKVLRGVITAEFLA